MLRITNLNKSYGETKAVNNLSLHIEKGEIYGFIGHNGAGKTTTIKSVAGIFPFDSGEILIDGIDIIKNPIAAKSLMAYIPDNPDIYDYMKGIQYLNFIADIFSLDSEARLEKIDKYSSLFEIKENLEEPISSYSHGMKQKLVLVSAFMHDPKLMLLDEPFVGLDPKASFTLKSLMRELCNNGGAIFFSTHVLDVAEKLCDKVAIIKNGEIIKSGTMSEVKGDESLEEAFLKEEEDD